MATIVVPTDFSETAAAALRFARQLAEHLRYDLEVVHAHDGHSEEPAPLGRRGDLQARAEVNHKLDRFIRFNTAPAAFAGSEFPEAPEASVKRTEIVGDPINILLRRSKQPDTALIVMGGVGSGAPSAVMPLFGSIARSVALGADCPVLLVPAGVGVPAIKRAALAYDTVPHLRQIDAGFRELREIFTPAMHFVHVQDKDQAREVQQEVDLLKSVTETDFPGYPVDYDALEPGKVGERLLEFTDETDVDLLVVGQRKLGFFQRLFVGSETASVVNGCPIPVLVIPLTD